jgi:ubiquitin-protein ligase
MNIRRLVADYEKLMRLNSQSGLVEIVPYGNPPQQYIVTYHVTGIMWPFGTPAPQKIECHQLEVYLHADYPRRPPRLRWLTEIFHPNILSASQNGGVCIGNWTPSESLADLVVRIGEMVQYKEYNVDDVLDERAADWARRSRAYLPLDPREIDAERRVAAAQAAPPSIAITSEELGAERP